LPNSVFATKNTMANPNTARKMMHMRYSAARKALAPF